MKLTQEQREAKVKRIDAIRGQLAKLAKEEAQLKAELREEAVLGQTVTAGGYTFTFKEVSDWHSFNKTQIGIEFPIEDWPEIYEPSYQQTKTLLQKLDKDVHDYCGTSERLYISKAGAKRGATRKQAQR